MNHHHRRRRQVRQGTLFPIGFIHVCVYTRFDVGARSFQDNYMSGYEARYVPVATLALCCQQHCIGALTVILL